MPPTDSSSLTLANWLAAQLCEESPDPDLSWLYPTIQRAIAESALVHTYGNQTRAAKLLGIHRETLLRHYHAASRWQSRAL